jgi:hypothetical protein
MGSGQINSIWFDGQFNRAFLCCCLDRIRLPANAISVSPAYFLSTTPHAIVPHHWCKNRFLQCSFNRVREQARSYKSALIPVGASRVAIRLLANAILVSTAYFSSIAPHAITHATGARTGFCSVLSIAFASKLAPTKADLDPCRSGPGGDSLARECGLQSVLSF